MKVMEPPAKPRSARSRGAVTVAVALGWIVVMLALAEVLVSAQADARRGDALTREKVLDPVEENKSHHARELAAGSAQPRPSRILWA